MKYVNLVIDNNSKHTDTFFTYKGTDDLEIGQVVNVPFNRGNTVKTGYVFQIDVEPDFDVKKIKEIQSINHDVSLSRESVETCKWMKRRYGIKYLDAVKCFIPNGKPAKEGKQKEPYKDCIGEEQVIRQLTKEQEEAVNLITESVENNQQDNFLIHGVTSSGKTEVYMQVIAQVIKVGKTAIMLVPEIALTKQVTERFISRFGKENIAVLHSKLTKRQRFDEWTRIRTGKVRIVIGARMAVFAPLENIGAIILDEEHEATYKSDMTPKYETVDVALKRLIYYRGVLILGSATPSVVSYQRAKEGIYKLVELKNRYNNIPLPKVTIVDMKNELREGNTTIFSDKLYREMKQTLESGQQVILFLNRRGYSTYISCKECGDVMKCSECGITLTYHKSQNAAICHYCGRKYKIPDKCSKCGSNYIKFVGTGTEKVEEYTKELFNDYTVDRLDLDTAKNTKEISNIISSFSKGKTNILIGTQLVAKGLDFKNVGLVGVVAADVSLNIPDYRSTERTFQLVTQVAGRAGRGDKEGKVIVQSYTPENFALTTAAKHDYNEFFEMEIKLRKFMEYPPFSDMIMVAFTCSEETQSVKTAYECKKYLEKCKLEEADKNIFDPRLSNNFIGKDSFRYYIMIKCPKGWRNKYIYYIDLFGEYLTNNNSKCNMMIDVNPYSAF